MERKLKGAEEEAARYKARVKLIQDDFDRALEDAILQHRKEQDAAPNMALLDLEGKNALLDGEIRALYTEKVAFVTKIEALCTSKVPNVCRI